MGIVTQTSLGHYFECVHRCFSRYSDSSGPFAGAALSAACYAGVMAVVYQDYMWTRPDTRLVAKEWIEANIPSGAKILVDGMRYRFVQSPPLNPDKSTVDHRVAQASEAGRLSRGISRQTLALYAKAMNQVKGPTYRLH